MTSVRTERLRDELKALGARFLEQGGNGASLLTVTDVRLSGDKKLATIFFTAFPESYEKTALEFAKRKRSEFKQFIRDKSRIPRIPHIDFEIDLGEKNRQRIDELSNQG
ncbi:MAG: ribosome-binding factor A [Candidatus Zambryskibacteria bacterium]|nr:ribosome-binding factor A [Candidatus Zambryskibacteria bacterium]